MMFTLVLILGSAAHALPPCHPRAADQPPRDALPASAPDAEVLARLVYAEATSTGFPEDPLVHLGIAHGAMARVRLAEISAAAASSYGKGVRGVVFKPSQFNPAVSTRSPFAAEFLCPKDEGRWALSADAADAALGNRDNPFLQTPWEIERGISLVVNFYYPASIQARGPLAPWEGSTTLTFLGDVPTPRGPILASKVRFYRLTRPPG